MMSTEDSSQARGLRSPDEEEAQIDETEVKPNLKSNTTAAATTSTTSSSNESGVVTEDHGKSHGSSRTVTKPGGWTDKELFGIAKEESTEKSDGEVAEDTNEREELEDTSLDGSGAYAAEPASLYRAVNGKWEEIGRGYLRCVVIKWFPLMVGVDLTDFENDLEFIQLTKRTQFKRKGHKGFELTIEEGKESYAFIFQSSGDMDHFGDELDFHLRVVFNVPEDFSNSSELSRYFETFMDCDGYKSISRKIDELLMEPDYIHDLKERFTISERENDPVMLAGFYILFRHIVWSPNPNLLEFYLDNQGLATLLFGFADHSDKYYTLRERHKGSPFKGRADPQVYRVTTDIDVKAGMPRHMLGYTHRKCPTILRGLRESLFNENVSTELCFTLDRVFLLIYLVHALKGDIRISDYEADSPIQLWRLIHTSLLDLSKHWNNELFVRQLIHGLKADVNGSSQCSIVASLVFDQLNLKSICTSFNSEPFARALCEHGILELPPIDPFLSLLHSKANNLNVLESIVRECPQSVHQTLVRICVSGEISTFQQFIRLCLHNFHAFGNSVALFSCLWNPEPKNSNFEFTKAFYEKCFPIILDCAVYNLPDFSSTSKHRCEPFLEDGFSWFFSEVLAPLLKNNLIHLRPYLTSMKFIEKLSSLLKDDRFALTALGIFGALMTTKDHSILHAMRDHRVYDGILDCYLRTETSRNMINSKCSNLFRHMWEIRMDHMAVYIMEKFSKVVEPRKNLIEFDGLYKLYEMSKEKSLDQSIKNDLLALPYDDSDDNYFNENNLNDDNDLLNREGNSEVNPSDTTLSIAYEDEDDTDDFRPLRHSSEEDDDDDDDELDFTSPFRPHTKTSRAPLKSSPIIRAPISFRFGSANNLSRKSDALHHEEQSDRSFKRPRLES